MNVRYLKKDNIYKFAIYKGSKKLYLMKYVGTVDDWMFYGRKLYKFKIVLPVYNPDTNILDYTMGEEVHLTATNSKIRQISRFK